MAGITGDLFDLAAGNARLEFGVETMEKRIPGFLKMARAAAFLIYKAKGQVSSDDVREWASRTRNRPHHPNAWGAVFKPKGWKPIGWKRSTLASNHARMIRVWEWRPGD